MGGEVETEARMEGDEAVGEGRAGNREIKGEENGIDVEDEIRDERGSYGHGIIYNIRKEI